MGRRIIDGLTRDERVNRRRVLGSLQSLLIKPATVTRYQKAFALFVRFLAAHKMPLGRTLEILDSQVQLYLDSLWADGESLSLAGDTLSALQHFQPSCKRRLPGGWRCLRAWQLHELPSRAPPFTWPTLLVFLGRLAQISPSASLGVHLAFRALLRTGELLSLESSDIVVAPNLASAVLHLGLTKTGARNPAAGSVTITDHELVQKLAHWQKHLRHSTRIIPWSGTRFRQIFHSILDETGLLRFHFKPYSLRRGGATDLWLSTQNYSLVAHTGRWSTERTLKIYVQDSISLLTSIAFSPSPQQKAWQRFYLTQSRVEPARFAKAACKGRGRGK